MGISLSGCSDARLDEVADEGDGLKQIRLSRSICPKDSRDSVELKIWLGRAQEDLSFSCLWTYSKLHEGFLLKGGKVTNRQ